MKNIGSEGGEEDLKWRLRDVGNLLTDTEKKWLESMISYADYGTGFEPKDIEMKKSIFSKLGIN